MKKRTATALFIAVLAAGAAGAQTGSETDATDARKAKIVANLQLRVPQLADATVVVSELAASRYAGLDQGTLTINFQQTLSFLVSSDDTELYVIAAGPIDVSLGGFFIAGRFLNGAQPIDAFVPLIEESLARQPR